MLSSVNPYDSKIVEYVRDLNKSKMQEIKVASYTASKKPVKLKYEKYNFFLTENKFLI
jgi:hypothetical protein